VQIDGDDALQQGLRFNAFHLLQSVGRDGRTNIAAKGLTGEGYEGHTFWDTEIYVLPFFLATMPEIARRLLEYRYQGLSAARERARTLAHKRGALFPWRTIAGDECSAYFPAGTAQYHLNADIAHALKQYVETTGDEAFLIECGAELLMETARIWLDVGAYDARHSGRFCIYEVTGPSICSPTSPSTGGAPRISCTCRWTRRWACIRRTTASSASRCGTSRRRRPTPTRCCCTTTRW
jgi:alpha,alpha-trehalose phosphorylase